MLGLHTASGAVAGDVDATLVAAAVLDVGGNGAVAAERLPFYDDEHRKVPATANVSIRVVDAEEYAATEGAIERDAVIVYEKGRAPTESALGAFLCASMGLVGCEAGADEVVICGGWDDVEVGAGAGDGDVAGTTDAPGATDASLEIEEGELAGPASVHESGGGDDGWIRLGSCVPGDIEAPRSHRPKPASLDKAYGSFRRSDRAGQQIVVDWHLGAECDADGQGWAYAEALAASEWHDKGAPARIYRRQLWYRYAHRSTNKTAKPPPAEPASGAVDGVWPAVRY